MDRIAPFIYAYGYPGVFALLMLGIVGLPVPDEWLLVFTGYLAFRGYFHIVPTLAVAALGSISGISVSYWLGRSVGSVLVRRFGDRLRVTKLAGRSTGTFWPLQGNDGPPTGRPDDYSCYCGGFHAS